MIGSAPSAANAGIEKEAANSSRSAIFFIWVTGVINLCKGSNIFRKANRFSGCQNPFQAVETLGQQFARAGDVQADEAFARGAVHGPGVDVQAAFVQQPSGERVGRQPRRGRFLPAEAPGTAEDAARSSPAGKGSFPTGSR